MARRESYTADDIVINYYKLDVDDTSLLPPGDDIALATRRDNLRKEIKKLARHKDTDEVAARSHHKKLLEIRAIEGHLITSNLRLVISIAKPFRHFSSFTNLIQEGNIGLMRAVKKYDPTLGYRLSTYATFWIRQAVFRAMGADHVIHIPAHKLEDVRAVRKAVLALGITYVEDVTEEDMCILADAINQKRLQNKARKQHNTSEARLLTPLEVKEAIEIIIMDPKSLDGFEYENEEGQTTLDLFIPDKDADVENLGDTKIRQEQIEEIMARVLTAREDRVLCMRNGFRGSGSYTLEEIGDSYGLTRERIRQIEKKAQVKLHKALYECGLVTTPPLIEEDNEV